MGYYNEYSSTKTSSDKFNYLKKFAQIVVSVSLLTLLFSQSSAIYSYDYLVANFSFKFKIFTYTTERNCIFLLCNGILVLIIRTSGLISKIITSDKTDDHHEFARIEENKVKGSRKAQILEEKVVRENERGARIEENKVKGSRKAQILEEKVVRENGGDARIEENKVKGSRKGEILEEQERENGGDARIEENKVKGSRKAEILEDQVRENGGDDDLGAEFDSEEEDEWIDNVELNKKCEEFIKKMKQEIQGA